MLCYMNHVNRRGAVAFRVFGEIAVTGCADVRRNLFYAWMVICVLMQNKTDQRKRVWDQTVKTGPKPLLSRNRQPKR